MRRTNELKLMTFEKTMKSSPLRLCAILLLLILSVSFSFRAFALNTSFTDLAAPRPAIQYDDPYSDFRNVKYSNAGLLNERDEIKLGTQLHREVTKKFNLTDTGLARADRLGQRCAQASLRPSLVYKFHVIQSREINGFLLPGGHVYVPTALL